jgi:hypothetical protein
VAKRKKFCFGDDENDGDDGDDVDDDVDIF